MNASTYRVLVLYAIPDPRYERLTTLQHLAAVSRLDEPAEVLTYNAVRGAPSWLRQLRFDAVVLHTTLLCQRWTPTFARWKRRLEWLADVPAVKIALPQDEYDLAHVLDQWLDELGVSVVCTVLDDRHRSELYPTLAPKATFYEVLTGYIDENSAHRLETRIVPPSDRAYDLVYRARNLPYWYGSHSQSKHLIAQETIARAATHALSYDISTSPDDAILGEAWLDFLGSGRATIGTESGTSVLDGNGQVQARVRELLAAEPGLSFDQVSRLMPAGWDDYRFLAISPRHLEAVTTKTAQILVRGRYSGVLEAGRHYIPVEPDFSDLDDALEQLREPGLADRIAEQAYEDVFRSGRWSARQLTRILGSIICEHSQTASGGRGHAFAIGAPLARTQRRVERELIPLSEHLTSYAKGGAAVLRLLIADGAARRLLALYLRSGTTREHVGLRDALLDLLCVSWLRQTGTRVLAEREGFRVELNVDDPGLHLTLRSVADRQASDRSTSRDAISRLLSDHVWDLAWDHSAISTRADYPILSFVSAPLPLNEGVRTLNMLSWLARERPREVAGTLAPVLD